MHTTTRRNSTTVRNALTLAMLRASNRIGGQFAPEAAARRAARLFCTPLPGGRVRARDADDGGALSSDIEVGGRRVAVYQWGDVQAQPRVLLAHGWSSYVLRMLPWVHALRQAGFAVIGFDHRDTDAATKGPARWPVSRAPCTRWRIASVRSKVSLRIPWAAPPPWWRWPTAPSHDACC